MPLNFQFEFAYPFEPSIGLRLRSPLTGRSLRTSAQIDTGADMTIFDVRIASAIGMDTSTGHRLPLRGFGGVIVEGVVLDVELLLLEEDELQIRTPVVFAPSQATRMGNIIGLDVLEHFDFGLSHAQRLGYLGRTAG